MQVVPSFTFSLLRGAPAGIIRYPHSRPDLLRAQGPGTAWDSVCPVVTPGTV